MILGLLLYTSPRSDGAPGICEIGIISSSTGLGLVTSTMMGSVAQEQAARCRPEVALAMARRMVVFPLSYFR
jgi:hypothetical protein